VRRNDDPSFRRDVKVFVSVNERRYVLGDVVRSTEKKKIGSVGRRSLMTRGSLKTLSFDKSLVRDGARRRNYTAKCRESLTSSLMASASTCAPGSGVLTITAISIQLLFFER
jgi:hypothetical protein